MRNKIRQLAFLSDSGRTAWAKPPNPAAVRTLSTVRTGEYSVCQLLRVGLQREAPCLQLRLRNVVPFQKYLHVIAPSYIQQGAGNYRRFFFKQTSTRDSIPTLLLLESSSFFKNDGANVNLLSGLVGHDYHGYGPLLRLFVTQAECGERIVVAPHSQHLQTNTAAAQYLDTVLRFLGAVPWLKNIPTSDVLVCRCWIGRGTAIERHLRGYNPFNATSDATLGDLGRHTHRNSNTGRRHAAVHVGPALRSHPELTRGQSLVLNRARYYPRTNSVGRWRDYSCLEGVPK